ncbi:MAG: BlaI/MecI/CopY family transcriptional regulator [Planctomycetota bacterium]
MSRTHQLGELQLAIMRVLWARGEATAGDVHAALAAERGLAPTTIATMLRKMEDKGVVAHREEGRAFVYRAAVQSDQVHRHMVGDLVERLFDGDPLRLVNHLVEQGEIELGELDDLRAAIADARRKAGPAPKARAVRRRGGRS